MEKKFIVPTLIALAMICSCQKQDSAAETQLAQRKAGLDLRQKALDEREKAVAERENAVANSRIIQPRTQVLDAAQINAEREKKIQQLPPELRALIPATPDPSRMKAERDRKIQELLSLRQRRLEELQRTGPQMQNQNAMSAATATPAAVYPQAEAASPSPSPTPQ
jgi:hypothetical protein